MYNKYNCKDKLVKIGEFQSDHQISVKAVSDLGTSSSDSKCNQVNTKGEPRAGAEWAMASQSLWFVCSRLL